MIELEFDEVEPQAPWTLESLNARIDALEVGEVLRIEDLSNELYHKSHGVSTSQLKVFIDCPYRYHAMYVERSIEFEDKPCFAFGRAGHTAILEPHKFELDYIRQPDDIATRTGAKWEYFKEQATRQGKEVLSGEFYDAMPKLQKSIKASKYGEILTTGGVAEVSYWMNDQESGMVIKCRPDYELKGGKIISDLKTSVSTKPSKIERKFKELGYHIQDALYSYIVKPDAFVFVAIESKAPHVVTAPIEFDADVKRLGYLKFKKALRDLKQCHESGVWPMYTEKKVVISATKYELNEIERLEGEL